ncbi:MAG: zinc finger domain-containing protein [Bacteroidia bacterium]
MSNQFNEKTAEVDQHKIKCKGCAAFLTYEPGTTHLKCQYCGDANEIKAERAQVEEIDFESFIAQKMDAGQMQEISTVKCDGCGASTTLKPNITSDACPFCATPLVIKNGTTSSIIRPKYTLPFKIDRKKADQLFIGWVGGLWFAPSDLKAYASRTTDKLNGMYLPYWTYDSKTYSSYSGQRGDHYYVTESYSTTENGQEVTRTREVQKTAWTFVTGYVHNTFDDILVCASKALPDEMTRSLEPWDLPELVDHNDAFLSGFKAESYQVGVKDGFDVAKGVMKPEIEKTIMNDIGGDVQRVDNVDTQYNDVSFKHILLPMWISAYRYNEKVYRFLINARTGEVQGERPYSAMKIFLFVLSILIVIAAAVYFWKKQ